MKGFIDDFHSRDSVRLLCLRCVNQYYRDHLIQSTSAIYCSHWNDRHSLAFLSLFFLKHLWFCKATWVYRLLKIRILHYTVDYRKTKWYWLWNTFKPPYENFDTFYFNYLMVISKKQRNVFLCSIIQTYPGGKGWWYGPGWGHWYRPSSVCVFSGIGVLIW